MHFELLLHAGTPDSTADTALLFGLPAVIGAVAAALTAAAVLLAGWRAGFAAAALGGILLGGGLVGDLVSHHHQEHLRHDILVRMVQAPSVVAAHQLMDLDEAETQNVWHFVTAGGQGLLLSGFAGAAIALWHRGRVPRVHEDVSSVDDRQAA